jgi:hypothetical protein
MLSAMSPRPHHLVPEKVGDGKDGEKDVLVYLNFEIHVKGI